MATVGDDGYDPGRAALKTLLLVSGCRVEDMGLVRGAASDYRTLPESAGNRCGNDRKDGGKHR